MRGAFAVVIAALAAGCLDPGAIECADGRLCPVGTQCVTDPPVCATQAQIDECQGVIDGTVCDWQASNDGLCVGHVCQRKRCGDGFVSPPEQCDGTNLNGAVDCTSRGYHDPNPLGCNDDCTYDESQCGGSCGDSVIDTVDGEECDGTNLGGTTCASLGYYHGTLTCLPNCQYNLGSCFDICGDGALQMPEVCDGSDFGGDACTNHGYYSGSLTCAPTCDQITFGACVGRCGDGFKNGPEACDGTDFGGATCQSFGYTGQTGSLRCDVSCDAIDTSQCTGYCGDGVVNGGEECDGLDTGGEDCSAFGAIDGVLGCNAFCVPDTSRCHYGRFRRTAAAGRRGIAFARDDAWVVDVASSDTLHWNGVSWTAVPTGATAQVNALWGRSSTDLWLVGDSGTIRHYNGASWSAWPSLPSLPAIRDIWSDGTNVYIAGGFGVDRWNGASWVNVEAIEMSAITGTGPNAIFAVGPAGALAHYDGAWHDDSISFGPSEYAVWASGPADAWAVGGDFYQHWNGTSWSQTPAPVTGTFDSAWGSGPDDVYASGADRVVHWDGNAWSLAFTAPTPIEGVFGSDAADVWAGGSTLYHDDGPGWIATSTPLTMQSLSSTGADDVWAAGLQLTILHDDGTAWLTSSSAGGSDSYNAVRAFAPDDVWAVADGGEIAHYDGVGWSFTSAPNALLALWGTSSNDLWAAGASGTILHHDASGWTQLASPVTATTLTSAWGSTPDDVWFVGYAGPAAHWDGTALSAVTLPFAPLAIWGSARDDVWAVGTLGRMEHYDGTAWTAQPSVAAVDLRAIAGAAPDDAWAVGVDGERLRFDGSGWHRMPANDLATRTAVSATPGDVWVATSTPSFEHLADPMPQVFGGACGAVDDVFCGDTTYGAITASTVDRLDGYGCGARSETGGERAYRLQVPVTGRVDVQLTPSSGDADLIVVPGDALGCEPAATSCQASETVGSAAEQVTVETTRGQTWYVVVDAPAGVASGYQLSVDCRPVP